ncbi:MAG: indole-3-glycerol phosphate synthase TrpC [Anaerolineae bacterium]
MIQSLSYFDEIIAYKKKRVAQQQVITPLASLRALSKMQDRPRDVSTVLREEQVALFSHVINPNSSLGQPLSGTAAYDPVALARRLVRQGAQALVVSTDSRYDGGSIEHLTLVSSAVDVPVVRHDYILDEYQIVETRAAGGDGLFLYPAMLSGEQLRRLISATQRNLMTVIACVHNREELLAVLPYEPRIVAINNHDPRTDQTDLTLTSQLVELIPGHMTVITMGGLESPWDVVQVATGVDGVLVKQAMLLIPSTARSLRQVLGLNGYVSSTENGESLTTNPFL